MCESRLKSRVREFSEFSLAEQLVLNRIEEIVWSVMAEELPCSSQMLQEIRHKLDPRKGERNPRHLDRTGLPASRAIYVGDSITDVEAFRSLDEHGGVSISFNGNQHAVRWPTLSAHGEFVAHYRLASQHLPALRKGGPRDVRRKSRPGRERSSDGSQGPLVSASRNKMGLCEVDGGNRG